MSPQSHHNGSNEIADFPAGNRKKWPHAGGAPKGNGNRLKHGYFSLVKLVRNRGGALDKRTILSKMVQETIRDLTASLGGDLSVQEQMLVDDVALDTLLLKSLNNTVASVQPLRKGKAHAAYQLRASLIAQRREHLKLLGIKRVSRTLSLNEILAKPEDGNSTADEGNEGR